MSHVDKINTLMIINSNSILTITATCITLVAFPFLQFLCVQMARRMKKKGKKDLKIK
jgi:hypothetical protein